MIGLPRSTFYYRSTARQVELGDDKVAEMINTIQDEFPGYGYRRVTRELAARGACINHKRAARIMRERGLYAVTKPKFSLKPKSGDEDGGVFPNLYRNAIPNALDRVGVADFSVPQISSVRDEGRSLAIGLQAQVANHHERLGSKAPVVSVMEKVPVRHQVWVNEDEQP